MKSNLVRAALACASLTFTASVTLAAAPQEGGLTAAHPASAAQTGATTTHQNYKIIFGIGGHGLKNQAVRWQPYDGNARGTKGVGKTTPQNTIVYPQGHGDKADRKPSGTNAEKPHN